MGRINKAWLDRRKSKTPSVQTVVDLPADALLKSVNDTAGNARNLFVTYILLSVYIFLTVGATNDEQLFRDSSVAVPFLSNINLPVSRFYQFVPWMFLFVHVDLLLLFQEPPLSLASAVGFAGRPASLYCLARYGSVDLLQCCRGKSWKMMAWHIG